MTLLGNVALPVELSDVFRCRVLNSIESCQLGSMVIVHHSVVN